jgi:hypothetical protein
LIKAFKVAYKNTVKEINVAGGVVLVVECLPSKHRGQHSQKKNRKKKCKIKKSESEKIR